MPVFEYKAFTSQGGFAEDHFINLDLANFPPKDEVTYSYEIQATTQDGDTAKKTGTFRLLTRPYTSIYPDVKNAADLNRDKLCSQLFFLSNDFIVCLAYKAES